MYYINSSSQSLLSLYYRSYFKSHESSPASRSSRFYIYQWGKASQAKKTPRLIKQFKQSANKTSLLSRDSIFDFRRVERKVERKV